VVRKLFNTLSIVALAVLLAGGGFAGYLFGTGKLDGARIEKIAAVLRGELDEPTDVAAADEAAAEVAEETAGPTATTAEEVAAIRRRQHLESLLAERAARDLEARRLMLDQTMQHVVEAQEALERQQERFAHQQDAIVETRLDEGFRKELEYVASLPPRNAKEHLVRVWRKQPADAVRLLVEMDASRGRRILEQLRTDEELEIQTDLLERIRLYGTETGYATKSGMTGDAAP
jgi:hypothetical protein